jgi:hypothetical protein
VRLLTIHTTARTRRGGLARLRKTLSSPHLLAIAEDYGLEAIENHVILTKRSINSGNTGLRTCPVV